MTGDGRAAGAAAPEWGEVVPGARDDPRVVVVALDRTGLVASAPDLARLLAGVATVDVLVACADAVVEDLDDGWDEDGAGDGEDWTDEWDEPAEADGLRPEIAELDRPGLVLHRLGLPAPLAATAEDDLVAAVSELVGFDPEPGVHLLTPVPQNGCAEHAVLGRVARRIARVYGIPLVRYRVCAAPSAASPPDLAAPA